MQKFIGGMGCFWDETKYEGIPGVTSTECGYCGGKNQTVSYEQVCGGNTEHVEVVKVEFDPKIISYEEVTKLFFKFHDPTTLNRQGPNVGYQYRSEIFYNTDEEKLIAEKILKEVNKKLNGKVVTKISKEKILKKNINSHLLSGGTDLSLVVTKERKDLNSVIYMNSINELNYIKNNNQYIEVGATTPLIEFESYIEKYYPDFTAILKRYGSVQIRNVATVAGNIATASPIGDTLPLLLSLDAKVVLRSIKKTKIISLNDFFIDYRKTKLKKGQFIDSIRIPLFPKNIFKAYKISKRFDDDISSVCAAFNLEVINKKIKNIRVAYGGMALIPKRAKYCEKILLNSSITEQIINKAKEALEKDFKPISDMRASRKYRMEVAKNLLNKFFLEITQNKLIRVNN